MKNVPCAVSGILKFVFIFVGLLLAQTAPAQNKLQQLPLEISNNYVAAIELHTTAELHAVLLRADKLLAEGVALQGHPASVTFVLHGPEVRSLLRQNYLQNKSTVDLAARLSALGVVEIKACETWMGGNSVNPEELQPFVGTVNYGPAEIDRLIDEESYIYF